MLVFSLECKRSDVLRKGIECVLMYCSKRGTVRDNEFEVFDVLVDALACVADVFLVA